MAPPGRTRVALVDALRAVALIGILQVNIQSFVWGAGEPLGYFKHPPSATDTATWWLVSTLASTKFMTLFALLFGFGAARLHQYWVATQGRACARRWMRRRLWFLLAVGVAHGTLLYFGDILTLYALCGFLLVWYLGVRPKRLARSARNWGLVYVALTLGYGALISIGQSAFQNTPEARHIPDQALNAFSVYTQAGYWAQWTTRLADYQSVLLSGALYTVPLIMALFLLGALAARLGWVEHPQRHPRVWRVAIYTGVLGLVLSLVGTLRTYPVLAHTPSSTDALGFICTHLSVTTTALYIALAVHWRAHPVMNHIVAWLAPAGRMPLTHYVTHSILMGALLSGWGLGLGRTLSHAQLALMALIIVAAQLLLARVWMAYFGSGPLERIWRYVTNPS